MSFQKIRSLIQVLLVSIFLFVQTTVGYAETISTGKYRIYTVDATTRQATMVSEGIEKKKAKVIRLCQQATKTYKESGISCLWNGKIVFTKKAPKPQKVTPIETREFVGLINGRIATQKSALTREKASELCQLMIQGNQQSEVSCSWGADNIGTHVAGTPVVANTIELIKSTASTSTGKYLARTREQEIGSFAIRSTGSGGTAKIQKIIIKNLGSARLRNIVERETDAKMIDVESNKIIPANIQINDSSIEFTQMNESLSGNTTRQYKIVLSIMNYPDNYDNTTIGLSLDPENIEIVDQVSKKRISLIGGVLDMKTYIIGKTAPTISITNIGENLFRLTVNNTDENYPLSITSIGANMSFTLPSGQTFNGILCVREKDVSENCGSNKTTTISVPSQGNNISLVGSSMNSYIPPKASLDLDLYVSSNLLYPNGSETQIVINQIGYLIDGKNLIEPTGGLSTSRTIYRK